MDNFADAGAPGDTGARGGLHRLEALPVRAGARAVDAAPALSDALDGRASLLPVPAEDPARAELLMRSQRSGEPISADVALVACTSGSTGTPKGAMLTAGNLRASIDATHARLGGPGQWLLATPPTHIAGLQVLLRTIRAGEEPIAVDAGGGFRPEAFTRAVAAMTGRRRYSSLVPLQLRRLLADAEAARALARLDAVLVGGQATPPGLLAAARAAGVTAVTSYGSSETAGGIAYDGRPLDGAEVCTADDGRIIITGPMVARGYRAGASEDLRPGVFRTSDAGRIDDAADGPVLTVLGRTDDIINSGGLKFLPGPIEDALAALDDVADAAVTGVAHAELGQAVIGAVTLRAGVPVPRNAADARELSERLRRELAGALEKHQVPRGVVVVTQLPTLASGKLDRAGLAATAAARWEMMAE